MTEIKTVDAKILKKWLEKDEAYLIDVREAIENKEISINGSKLISLKDIDINKINNLTNKKIVIHCKSGKRGNSACQKLLEQDNNLEIYNLAGGIDDWQNCGFAVNKNKNYLPLGRQVQIIAGSCTFLGTILGLLFSHWFFVIPLFFGAGLTFAGITGWCGMAMILAKLPFNK